MYIDVDKLIISTQNVLINGKEVFFNNISIWKIYVDVHLI